MTDLIMNRPNYFLRFFPSMTDWRAKVNLPFFLALSSTALARQVWPI
jgi:hypothetical protein